MLAAQVDVHELPSRLGEFVALAAAGTEVIVMAGNVPQARLVPLSSRAGRVPDLHPGAIQTTDDFDAPLPEEFWTGTE